MEQTTYQDQARNTYACPDRIYAVLMIQAFYNRVYKLNKEGKVVQAYANLMQV